MKIAFLLISLIFQFNIPINLIDWDKTSHNFGNVNKNETLNTEFKCYNNDSSQVLIIENVVPSCGCIVSKPSKNKIPFKDSAIIEVNFNVGKKKGLHHKDIVVYTNKGFIELSLKANVL
jgi:hypothetical protein